MPDRTSVSSVGPRSVLSVAKKLRDRLAPRDG